MSLFWWSSTSDCSDGLVSSLNTGRRSRFVLSMEKNNLHHYKSINQPIHRTIEQSTNQSSINQSINQWNNQSINQAHDQSINQSTNQTINQSINQSIKRTINQSIGQTIETTDRIRFSFQPRTKRTVSCRIWSEAGADAAAESPCRISSRNNPKNSWIHPVRMVIWAWHPPARPAQSTGRHRSCTIASQPRPRIDRPWFSCVSATHPAATRRYTATAPSLSRSTPSQFPMSLRY